MAVEALQYGKCPCIHLLFNAKPSLIRIEIGKNEKCSSQLSTYCKTEKADESAAVHSIALTNKCNF
jgi:hypothetical protein